ncbi:MAG: hypothetical protein ACRBF0_18670 [Calditrichia bacterium]
MNRKWTQLPAATCAIFMLLAPINQLLAQSQSDTLWQKAVAIDAANLQWVPGLLIENELVTDMNDKVEEHNERQIQFYLQQNGMLNAKLVVSRSNEEDVTQAAQKPPGNDTVLQQYLQSDEPEIPFRQALQANIITVRLPEHQTIDGIECVVYEYRQISEGIEWYGTAWLAKNSGIPVKIQFHTNESFTEDKTKISKIESTIFYKCDSSSWYAQRILYKMKIKTKLFPFFTFRGKVTTEISLSNYFSFDAVESGR